MDVFGVFISLVIAYSFKFKIAQISFMLFKSQFGQVYNHAQIEPYLSAMWLIITVVLFTFILFNGYRTRLSILPSFDEGFVVIKTMSVSILLILMINFFSNVVPESRFVIINFWIISMVLLSLFRILILKYEHRCRLKGIGMKQALIIGGDSIAQDIAERMVNYPFLGYQLCGFLDDSAPERIHFHLKDQYHLLGGINDYQSICNEYNIDSIFIVKQDISREYLALIHDYCNEQRITIHIMADSFFNTPFIHSGLFDGLPMLNTVFNDSGGFSKMLKRNFDIIVSFFGLILLFPVLFLIGCWIKLVSPMGGVLYRQDRVGKDGKVFKMVKFRSMILNAETESGPVMVDESGDDRYIRGGKFIRQYSIDELPQLWNVLIGEMSLVGPRPERPFFVDQFSKTVPFYNQRHVVPVGITGWAQVNGRSVLTRQPEQKIKYDIYYIGHCSFIMDLKILLKTIVVVLMKEEAY